MEEKIIKKILLVIDCTFLLYGVGLLITYAYLHEPIGIVSLLPEAFIIFGCAFAIVASLGFWLLNKENDDIAAFGGMVTILFISQIVVLLFALGILYIINTKGDCKHAVAQYWQNSRESGVIDIIQTHLQCCGAVSSDDYATGKANMNGTIPWSCCPVDSDSGDRRPCELSKAYNKGCCDDFADVSHKYAQLAVELTGGLLILMIVTLILIYRLLHVRGYDFSTTSEDEESPSTPLLVPVQGYLAVG